MNLKDYIRGERHGKEANRLEREAMEDPFLQGAIDGYDSVEGDHYSVIQKLERQLAQPRKCVNRRVWLAAAAALLLLLIGIPFLLHPPQPTDEPLVATTDTGVEKEIVKEKTLGEETLKKRTLEEKTAEEKVAEERTAEEEAAPLEEIVVAQATEEGKEVETIQATGTTGTTGITGITETTKIAEEHKVLDIAQVVKAKTEETTEAEETAGSTRTTKATKGQEALETAQTVEADETTITVQMADKSDPKPKPSGKRDHLRVSGRLLDEKGEPVVGATVLVENSKSGVVTDTDGKFSLSVPRDEKRPLIASFIGMHNETIPLKEDVGDITMKEDAALLSEVVVVAFGIQKRENLVGSTAAAKQDSSRTDDKALDQRGKEETDQFKVDEATTVAFGKKKAEAKASRGIKSITKESGEKDTEAVAFGEKEFKEYFMKYYDKSLCQDQPILFTVTFSIRSDGRPTGIQIQENSCPDLETEIKRLLLGSPLWTNTNRKVTLTVEIPGS